jgi:hypothetical protein
MTKPTMLTNEKTPAPMVVNNANPIKRKREASKQRQEERLIRMERILKNQGRRYPLWTIARYENKPANATQQHHP